MGRGRPKNTWRRDLAAHGESWNDWTRTVMTGGRFLLVAYALDGVTGVDDDDRMMTTTTTTATMMMIG